ncbi:hypothetical protein [Paenibacillus aurantius]|uniref:hypothetical protein n=1 Tax=Paenibacillus aurantius TaxID=2918900 RepID=UPI00387F9E8A
MRGAQAAPGAQAVLVAAGSAVPDVPAAAGSAVAAVLAAPAASTNPAALAVLP